MKAKKVEHTKDIVKSARKSFDEKTHKIIENNKALNTSVRLLYSGQNKTTNKVIIIKKKLEKILKKVELANLFTYI
jgi:hypothetical protein